MKQKIDREIIARIQASLLEDLGEAGDLTSLWTIPPKQQGQAQLLARVPGVFAGGAVFAEVFRCMDKKTRVELKVSDGDSVQRDQVLATVRGPLRSILSGERTALNLVTHLSGIASLTRNFVDLVSPYGVVILDTRKTTPLWRRLEKYAVTCGGGQNHRFGLFDMVLIKDNHVAAAGGTLQAIRAAKTGRSGKRVKIEVEVSSLDEAGIAAQENVDVIMLDNMTPAMAAKAVKVIAGAAKVEISGGINLKNIVGYAKTGIDYISIGALTHSAPALDMSLEIINR